MIKKLLIILLSLSFITIDYRPALSLDLISKSKEKKTEDKKNETPEKKPKTEINESEYKNIMIGQLLTSPTDAIDKKVKFKGKFNSFTTLALDYNPAMRSSKDYISITIFRPDTQIPLGELKMAYPVEEAKEDDVIKGLEKGDVIEIYGKGFSAALDEPWLDINKIKLIESINPKNKEELAAEKEKEEDKKKEK